MWYLMKNEIKWQTNEHPLPNHGSNILYDPPREYLGFGSEDLKRTFAVSGWHTVNTGKKNIIQALVIFVPDVCILSVTSRI